MRRALPGIAAAVVVLAAAWLLWLEPPAARGPHPSAGTAGAEPAPGPVAPAAPAAPATAPDRPAAAEIVRMPDGARMPALNGARGLPDLRERWPADLLYTPVVGRETASDGTEWYVHADGTRSTTRMRYRADLGREDAVFSVAAPAGKPPAAK